MKIKATNETLGSSLHRLLRAVRALGAGYGYRWWKIETRCHDEPELVPRWIEQCDREATDAMVDGDFTAARMLSSWADLLRTTYREWLLGGVDPKRRSESEKPESRRMTVAIAPVYFDLTRRFVQKITRICLSKTKTNTCPRAP